MESQKIYHSAFLLLFMLPLTFMFLKATVDVYFQKYLKMTHNHVYSTALFAGFYLLLVALFGASNPQEFIAYGMVYAGVFWNFFDPVHNIGTGKAVWSINKSSGSLIDRFGYKLKKNPLLRLLGGSMLAFWGMHIFVASLEKTEYFNLTQLGWPITIIFAVIWTMWLYFQFKGVGMIYKKPEH